MAIHVDRITVAAPVLNAITLGAGGSLTVGVTYYYRLIALRAYAGRYALSAASAEQAVTPTAGNQTAQLSWPAVPNASAYIIQRTTTPGSYPVEGQNTFNLNGQPYAGWPYATTLTSLNDDGGAATNIRFNSNNMDFDTEHALIDAYGDANDRITLWDISNTLVGGGFSDLLLQGSTALKAGTNWRAEGLYLLRGHLRLHDCIFRLYGPVVGLPGDLYAGSNVTLEIGHATNNYSPVFLHLGMPLIPYTSNNNTYTSQYLTGWGLPGRSGVTNIMRMFVERFINYTLIGNYGCLSGDRYGSLGNIANTDLIDSILGLGASNSIAVTPNANTKNNTFESIQLYGKVIDSVMRLGNYINLYVANNNIVQRCVTRDVRIGDMVPWYNIQRGCSIIDHLFKGKGQTNNQPYLRIYKNPSEVARAIFSVTRNFLILGSGGAPVQGAVITALNANGLSAFWEDSLATFSTALDAATDPASLTVSDGTKFSIGDYIRCECYGEVLKVTNIAGNVLTVARAQLGTTKRETDTTNCNRVLKMLASVTTDANGEVTCAKPTLQRELYSVTGSGGQINYEDTLITNGYLGRNFFGPYSLQIAKEGYQTYEYPLLDPDVEKYPLGPGTLEVALEPIEHYVLGDTVVEALEQEITVE
ncbi:MAG: hypothetical protein HY743_05095, partial [Deltaproteobacteria bacterium]|nr:hypothetical protein [Deltaproteobacteria bacterium]